MNVRCASCETVYRVDPDRLPLRGVRARCTVCSHVISIEGQALGSMPEAAPNRAFAPGTRDRVANALGDAFILPPEESKSQARPEERQTEEPSQTPVASEEPLGPESPFVDTAPAPADEAAPHAEVSQVDEEAPPIAPPRATSEPAEPVLRAPVGDIEPATPTPIDVPEPEPILESEPPVSTAWEPVEQESPSVDEPAEQPVLDAPPAPDASPQAAEPEDREHEAQQKPPVVPPWEDLAAQSAPLPPPPPSPVKPVAPEPPVPSSAPGAAEQSPKAPRPFAGSGQSRSAAHAGPTPPPDGRAGRQRLSRPFSVPRSVGNIGAAPGTTTGKPTRPVPDAGRPSAPVFTPGSGRPAQSPPVPPRQPPKESLPSGRAPVASVSPVPPAPAPTPASKEPTGRPVNPFLSRDPRQKARRLARALISDMIVYQPEKRQRAIRDGNLKEAFDDEIKKSWDEFVEQVGQEIAESTTHFNDALNDILAGGQKVF